MIRRLFLALLISCGGTVRGQDSAPNAASPLTLEEAVSIAQANNPNLKDALLASHEEKTA